MFTRLATLFLILFSLNSCMRMQDFAAHGEFEGVKTALQRQSCVNVILVHGMGGFSVGDPETLKCAIVKCLHLRKTGPDCTREVVDPDSEDSHLYGSLKREDYCDPCTAKKVRFYTLVWHPAVKPQLERLRRMDRRMRGCRLAFIEEIKKTIVNNAFADTFLYLSAFRAEMEYPIIQSVRWIVEDSCHEVEPEHLVVGYSMGGNLFINALDTMLHEEPVEELERSNSAVARDFMKEIASIYFLSNTYPLLELVEDHPERAHAYDDDQGCEEVRAMSLADTDCWNWQKSPIGRFVYAKREMNPAFQIVSFSDPNDLLSYAATDYPVPSGDGCLNVFLNENVRNARTSYFGYIDPRTAHTGYGSNPKILSLIIHGLRCSPCRAH